MEWLFIAALLGFIPAAIAKQKGHDPIIWWLGGALLFIVALPLAIILEPKQSEVENRKLGQGMKKCPFCAELVKQEAVICRFCGREFLNPNERDQLEADTKFARVVFQKLGSENQNSKFCQCNVCSGKIEFDMSQVGETIQCPHCGIETMLFIPSQKMPDFPTHARQPKRTHSTTLIVVAAILILLAIFAWYYRISQENDFMRTMDRLDQ